jgi:uncharacterized membrane protein
MRRNRDAGLGRIRLGKGRLEALSDGVFAIAMTLLVLDIRIPDLPASAPAAELLARLRLLLPALGGLVLTFLIAGAFWYLHQATFHFVRAVNRALCWLNLAFLLFVSLLPFSAGLLGRYAAQQPVAVLIYYANLACIAGLLWWHWMLARRAGLLDEERLSAEGGAVGNRIFGLFLIMGGGVLAAAARLAAPGIAREIPFLAPVAVLAAHRAATRIRLRRHAGGGSPSRKG